MVVEDCQEAEDLAKVDLEAMEVKVVKKGMEGTDLVTAADLEVEKKAEMEMEEVVMVKVESMEEMMVEEESKVEVKLVKEAGMVEEKMEVKEVAGQAKVVLKVKEEKAMVIMVADMTVEVVR